MQCAHCLEHYKTNVSYQVLQVDADSRWVVESSLCAACNRMNAFLGAGIAHGSPPQYFEIGNPPGRRFYPLGSPRPPLSDHVPPEYAALYNEAAAVLDISPRASGALSRRCLQQLIRAELGVTRANLYDEIEQVVKDGKVPGYLADQMHYVRDVGNMAAHPFKNPQTDSVVDVEPAEAEATLDLLDRLFEFIFVEAARAKANRAALDAKLGRPPTA